MQFGEDWFYNKLKTEFYSEDNSEICRLLYYDLLPIVKKEARRYLGVEDAKDAEQEAFFKLIRVGIPGYLKNPDLSNAAPHDRIAYIYKCIKRSCATTYIKIKKARGIIKTNKENDKKKTKEYDRHRSLDSVKDSENDTPAEILLHINRLEYEKRDYGEKERKRQDKLKEIEIALQELFNLEEVKTETVLVCGCTILLGMSKELGYPWQTSGKPIADAAEYVSSRSNNELIQTIEDLLSLIPVPVSILDGLKELLKSETIPREKLEAQQLSKKISRIRQQLSRKIKREE